MTHEDWAKAISNEWDVQEKARSEEEQVVLAWMAALKPAVRQVGSALASAFGEQFELKKGDTKSQDGASKSLCWTLYEMTRQRRPDSVAQVTIEIVVGGRSRATCTWRKHQRQWDLLDVSTGELGTKQDLNRQLIDDFTTELRAKLRVMIVNFWQSEDRLPPDAPDDASDGVLAAAEVPDIDLFVR